MEWTIKKFKIKDLKEHPKNPRTLSKEQHKNLTDSLTKFGIAEKPICNIDGTIIGGHQRLKVLKDLGYKEIDCWIPKDPLTSDQVDELNIRLNKNTGEWDWDCLANEWDMDDLLEWGFSAEELGLDLNQGLSDGDGDDADIDPPKEEDAVTKAGDLYTLGQHRLICGSSTETINHKKLFENELADLIVTDPPYNVAYVGKTKKALTIQNDSMEDGNFFQFILDAYKGMFEHLEAGGSIYVFHADSEGLNFRKAFKEAGFKLSECLIWKKNCMVMGRNDYQWQHEPILYGWKEGKAHNWYSDRKQTTILEYDKPSRSEEHPTMKPVAIVEYLIKNSSKESDVVFDPFLGSGTTLIAAEKLGRRCFGIELSPAYCDVIVKRYAKFMSENGLEYSITRNDDPFEPDLT